MPSKTPSCTHGPRHNYTRLYDVGHGTAASIFKKLLGNLAYCTFDALWDSDIPRAFDLCIRYYSLIRIYNSASREYHHGWLGVGRDSYILAILEGTTWALYELDLVGLYQMDEPSVETGMEGIREELLKVMKAIREEMVEKILLDDWAEVVNEVRFAVETSRNAASVKRKVRGFFGERLEEVEAGERKIWEGLQGRVVGGLKDF